MSTALWTGQWPLLAALALGQEAHAQRGLGGGQARVGLHRGGEAAHGQVLVAVETGEVTLQLQSTFEDALHGRAEQYRHWLDPVPGIAAAAEPEAGVV